MESNILATLRPDRISAAEFYTYGFFTLGLAKLMFKGFKALCFLSVATFALMKFYFEV